MLFRIDTKGKVAETVSADSFDDLPFHERYDIQEWVIDNPELLGEPLLVITSEFSGFDKTSERLDVLALDRNGSLVVVELKRSAIGTMADLQALRYAAYCSTFRLEDVAEFRAKHNSNRGQETTSETALGEIKEFVDKPEFEELDDKPRIILAADAFSQEITATALWLRSFEVDIRCVRMTPYSLGEDLVVDSAVLIPLPEAEDYIIRRERKAASRPGQGRAPRPSLEEFVAQIPENLRPLVLEMRKRIVAHPNVKETVFHGLLAYRRKSSNEWITWIQYTKTQARIAFPDDFDFPEGMTVKSKDGWTTLAVKGEADLPVILGLIETRFASGAQHE